MEDKKAKVRKNIIPAAESFSSPEAAGWLFKLIHEGWLRKRWRKRYCVLSNGILYFYEFKTSDGTEKTCSSLNLKLFRECVKAPRKDCKKSAHTLILEPAKKDDSSEHAKSAKTVQREFFYTETAEEQEKWIAKLQEALSFTCIGGSAKLTHITKNRARPPRGGGNRRPPTKQHIKERAMMAEVSLETDTSDEPLQNGPSKKRGQLPVSALKPPPGGRPKSQLKPLDLPPAPKSPPAVNGDPNSGEKDNDLPTPPPVQTPISPKPPPAALKPPSTKRVIAERTDSVGSGDGKSLPPPSPQLLKEISDIAEKNRSLPSSRASSLGKSDKSSFKSSKEPSVSSQPGTPPLSLTVPVIELEEARKDEEEPKENGLVLQKLNGNHHHLDFLNDVPEPSGRMAKAKSMVELDHSSEEDEPLPPPPTPPPPEELEKNGVNGDVKKRKKNEKIKKDKKGKKKKGKNRPSSLVLEA